MASGDTLIYFNAQSYEPPATNYATFDTRNAHPVLEFDSTTNEAAVWTCVMPQSYAGTTGVTVRVFWSADGVATGNVKWDGFFEEIADDTFDIDADGFTASPQTVTATTATVDGEVDYASITFTDGAQMDSVAAGDLFRFKLERDAADAADTMNSNDAQVLGVEIQET